MASQLSPRSSYLFARARAIHGVARVFDFCGVYDCYNSELPIHETDVFAVMQDWLAVEEDAKVVVGKHSLAKAS